MSIQHKLPPIKSIYQLNNQNVAPYMPAMPPGSISSDCMMVLMLLLFTLLNSSATLSKFVTIKDFRSHVHDPTSVRISYEVVNSTLLNYNLTVFKVYNVDVLCTLSIKKQQKTKMIPLLHWKHFNFCKFLTMFNRDKIFKNLFLHLIQPTFITSCPLREGFYYLKNAYFNATLIENIVSRGVYYSQMDISIKLDGISKILSNYVRVIVG